MDKILEFGTHHPLIVGATLLLLIAVLAFEFLLQARAGFEVSTPEAVRLINNGAAVVDVRAQTDYDAGHIVDAIRMPPSDLARGEETKIKKKRGVLVVCQNGSDSARCVAALRKAGFEGAFGLRGGVAAWQRDNQLLVPTRR